MSGAGQGPGAFRVVVAALVAGVVAEVLLGEGAWFAAAGAHLSVERLAASGGFGLGLGLALGLAEALGGRFGRVVGLLALVATSLLAPLGGAYAVEWLEDRSSLAATGRVLSLASPEDWAAFRLHAALLTAGLAPLLLARWRAAGLVEQVAAGCAGALAGVLALVAWPAPVVGASLGGVVLLLTARGVALPISLALADPVARLAQRALGQAPAPRERRASGWRARAWLVVVLAPAVIVGAGGRGLPWEIPWTRARALLAGPERLRELAGRLVDFTASGRRLPARWAPSEALALQEKGSLRSLTVRISLMIEESVRLDRLAASQGYVPSNLALDDALGRGRRDLLGGGPPSLEERLEILGWLLQAAETGEPTAMLRLGQRLAWGWSYQGGHRMMTALLVHDGEMWDVLAREGAAWLRRAADAGDEEAIWELAGVRDVWPRRRRVTETPEAIAWCRRLAPAHPRARTVLLGLLAERPDLRLAADDAFLDHLPDDASVATADLAGLRPVLRLDPAASPEARAALHLLEHGLTDPARALAEQALARDPSDVLANNVMAVLYLRRGLARPTLGRGHVQAAASYLRRAERVRPGDLATELNLALCDVHEALTADRRSGPSGPAWLARRRLLLVSDLHPGDPIGTAIRATVEQLFADRKIREDVSLDDARGWHSSALKRVADARRAAGDLEGAITGYTEAIGHSTGNLDPRLARSEARAATGDLAGALEDLDEAVRLAAAREPGLRTDLATLERALVARGDVRLRAGDLTGALADFDAAQATSPRNRRWDAALGKARVLRRQGALAEADLALTRLLVGWPDFVDALLELADLRAALGEPERALPDQTRALAVLRAVADPGRLAQVHVERARTFVALGRLREAIDDCSRAVALAPTSTSALLLRGPLRALGGERAVGVEDLARAAELGAREAGLWLAWLTGDAARLNEAPGDGWEGALVRHARGELADDALLAAALQGADDAATSARLCVAACALGVVAERAGDHEAARAHYTVAVGAGHRRSAEHAWAAARLGALRPARR